MLKSWVNGSHMRSAVSFNSFVGILSGPDDLFTSSELRRDNTSRSVAVIWLSVGAVLGNVASSGGFNESSMFRWDCLAKCSLSASALSLSSVTMDFKPSVSVLFGHYSLPWRRILTKLEQTKFQKTT